MLKVEGLRVSIKGFSILRGVNLEIPSGGLIGLVGRNGAGKTTTIKGILGLVPVIGGSLALDGTDLREVPSHKRAKLGIGYMPEDRRLVGALSVEDNVLMPAWATRRSDERQRLEYIYDIMPDVPPMARRRASTLSGGQQKMVALARAVMTGTKLLLLDEAFEGLSPASGEQFARSIQALQRGGLAILIAESDDKRLSFVNRIYTIERGEIVQSAAA
ncbi:MAG TPA: ATP-binding cassette domain-containing protein [Methylomirabilota bacterium]|jgi:branched-chain amino acid transport system ATP-binding protein|nr:ATP-binding cassette domain-containing protein [Methylomirabilota bacterium]